MEIYPKKKQTCCFTGHRPSKLPWGTDERNAECLALKERIREELNTLYRRGFRHFITGMAKGCDLYFAEAVVDLRSEHPDVTLEAAVPCRTQSDSWNREDQIRYQKILDSCDVETLIQRVYTRDCMLRRNRYMVERSGAVLAAYDGLGGGTLYTLNYAERNGLETIIIPIAGN